MDPRGGWTRFGSLLLFAAAAACGEDDERRPSALDAAASPASVDAGLAPTGVSSMPRVDAGEGCRTYVSDSLTQHACFHELMGPYAERMAGTSASATGIDLDRAHTSFRVALPPRPEGGFGGALSYQARFAGGYAVFARGGTVRVSSQGGLVAPSMTHATEVCSVLPNVSVYTFAQQTYTIEVTSEVRDVVLVIEYMDEGTVADAYRIECAPLPRPQRDAAVFVLDSGAGDAATTRGDGGISLIPDGVVPVQADAATGRGSEASDAGATDDAGPCQVDPVLEHSCLHAMAGPFEPVSGVSGSAIAPDISRPHYAWQMALPAASAGRFVYRPTMTGEYVHYLDRALPLTLRAAGSALMPTYVEPVMTCAGIVEARVYALTGGVRYDVEVGPTAGDRATLIIESVNALTARTWSERFEACP